MYVIIILLFLFIYFVYRKLYIVCVLLINKRILCKKPIISRWNHCVTEIARKCLCKYQIIKFKLLHSYIMLSWSPFVPWGDASCSLSYPAARFLCKSLKPQAPFFLTGSGSEVKVKFAPKEGSGSLCFLNIYFAKYFEISKISNKTIYV